ncbi:unnamed protein product, partial [marine sediment metagenome]
MYWQNLRLVDARALTGTSGVETVDLPESGILSSMDIRFDAIEDEATRNLIKGQIDCLTKIEVVHMGTQVIKSYTGRVARGIGFLDDQRIPFAQRGYAALGVSGYVYVPINFGRRQRDTEYAIDLSRLIDPKLKITWDCTITDPYTGGGFHSTTPVAQLTVITHTVRDLAVPPKGYIKTSQVKEYGIAASTIEDVKFPLGNPYRRIIIRPFEETAGTWGQSIPKWLLSKIELDINDGEKKPVQMKDEDYVNAYLRDY